MLRKTTNVASEIGVIGQECVRFAPVPPKPPAPPPPKPIPIPPYTKFIGGQTSVDYSTRNYESFQTIQKSITYVEVDGRCVRITTYARVIPENTSEDLVVQLKAIELPQNEVTYLEECPEGV